MVWVSSCQAVQRVREDEKAARKEIEAWYNKYSMVREDVSRFQDQRSSDLRLWAVVLTCKRCTCCTEVVDLVWLRSLGAASTWLRAEEARKERHSTMGRWSSPDKNLFSDCLRTHGSL